MPAVTTKLDSTKHDMRKGKRTGLPVSVSELSVSSACVFHPDDRIVVFSCCALVPGCSVESTIFLACHSSGVMLLISPFLYLTSRSFALSRPVLPAKRVLWRTMCQRMYSSWARLLERRSSAKLQTLRTRRTAHLGSVIPAVCLTRPQ